MNDFTKEELESIVNWGEAYTEFGHSWVDKMARPLIDKIKSMVDSYCEHDKLIPISYFTLSCEKCGKILNE